MSKLGYIKLHRQLQDCWIWIDEPFSRGQAWVDILLSCNHSDKKIAFDGKPYVVKRGEYLVSILALSNRWQWGRKKVSNFLNALEKDGMIEQKRNNKRTLIKVLNYDAFQCFDDDKGTTEEQQRNIKGTSEEHQRNTNNNDNNDKECINNNNIYMCAFEELWKIYPRKVEKANAYKQYLARLKSGFSEEELFTATKNYADECKKNKTEQRYIKHGSTFFSANTPFTDYLKKGSTDDDGTTRVSERTDREIEFDQDEWDRCIDENGFFKM